MGPADGVGRPGALEPAGDRVGALASAIAVLPAESLFLDVLALGLGTALAIAERLPKKTGRDPLPDRRPRQQVASHLFDCELIKC